MQQPVPQQNVTQTVIVQQGGAAAYNNGAVTMALLLAIASFVAAWIPAYATWGLIGGVIALVLAPIGLVVAILNRGTGLLASILAGIVAFAAMTIGAGSSAVHLIRAEPHATPATTREPAP